MKKEKELSRLILYSLSPQESHRLGQILGESLSTGFLVALSGDLGAGKTSLIQGIARGLKVRDRYITSPTFTLINEYQGMCPVYHFDVYRLSDPQEMEDLGYEEFFYGEGVTLVEWAEKIENLLPEDHLKINLDHQGPEIRRLMFTAKGKEARKVLGRFRSRIFQPKDL
ncbi:MAG: tRNA (adenosine(37)-N6)-threonylcarbamoyltransferase complex ATPase subunit type 1 TsaE [bacterium]